MSNNVKYDILELNKGGYMTLVIMAAGMGSRFGGLKQIEPIDEYGNFIIDYSIYDAIKEGFKKVVFIIKKENYDIFRDTVGKRVEKYIDVEYVFQELDKLPYGYSVPEDRVKPWGTGHAILCCKDVVKENFAIINSDDFYGRDAFKVIAEFLKNVKEEKSRFSFKKTMVILAVAAVVIAGAMSLAASSNPDGLEWSIEKITGSTEVENEGSVYDTAAAIQETTAVLPDYAFKNSDSALGTSFSGIIGGLVVVGVCVGACYIFKFFKKKES